MAKFDPLKGAKWHTEECPGSLDERYIFCVCTNGTFRIRCIPYRIDAAALAVRTISDEVRRRAYRELH